MSKTILILSLAVVLAGLFVFGCGKSDEDPYGGNNNNNNNNSSGNNVSIKGMSYSSASITVKAGTTVKWTNNDNTTHTVTANDNSFDSGDIAAYGTYSHTFNTAGTFSYHCKYHTMSGTVTVN